LRWIWKCQIAKLVLFWIWREAAWIITSKTAVFLFRTNNKSSTTYRIVTMWQPSIYFTVQETSYSFHTRLSFHTRWRQFLNLIFSGVRLSFLQNCSLRRFFYLITGKVRPHKHLCQAHVSIANNIIIMEFHCHDTKKTEMSLNSWILQFYFLFDGGGWKIASDRLTCLSARMENNIRVKISCILLLSSFPIMHISSCE